MQHTVQLRKTEELVSIPNAAVLMRSKVVPNAHALNKHTEC